MRSFAPAFVMAALLLVLLPAVVLSMPTAATKDQKDASRSVLSLKMSSDQLKKFDPKAILLALKGSSSASGDDASRSVLSLRMSSDQLKKFDPKAILLALKGSSSSSGDGILQKERPVGVSFWDYLLAFLHLLGITDEQIAEFLYAMVNGVQDILSQLPPEDIRIVEFAAGDILGIMQSGDYDIERLQKDFSIIYTIMWPYVDPDMKPFLELIEKVIIWLWQHYPISQQHSMSANVGAKMPHLILPGGDLKRFLSH